MSVRDVAICFELGSWLEVTIHICQQVLVSDLINSYLLPIKLHLTVRTQRRVRTNSRNCLSVRDVFFSGIKQKIVIADSLLSLDVFLKVHNLYWKDKPSSTQSDEKENCRIFELLEQVHANAPIVKKIISEGLNL